MTDRRRKLRRLLITGAAILAAATLAGCAMVWRPAIPPIAPPPATAFSTAAISRGAELAALGDCAVCHTATDGPGFAGGRAIETPFGMVYASNITPDPTTGIGRWPPNAFQRAMRDGIDRAGRHLYPVLPYPHFIHATDDDIAAIYAFLMTRPPVGRANHGNALPFPFNVRPLLAGWNLLFLRPGVWRPDPGQSAEWNRGAYLVEAIGHCGACHSPHNALGAEKRGEALSGGDAEGWYAPPLDANNPAAERWTVDQMTTYLRTGFDQDHGAASGPMTAVTDQLAVVPEADARAMATYIVSRMPAMPAEAGPRMARPAVPLPPAEAAAAAMFNGACGACHARDAPMTSGGAPSLALSSAVRAPNARDVVDVILRGLPFREGRADPYMPGFADALTDTQVASLAAYVRARYTGLPAWPDLDQTVRAARRQGDGS